MENEVWKDVVGYEGIYKVSNLGRIYSLPRLRKGANNSIVSVEGRFIATSLNTAGYVMCGLSKNAVQKPYFVHRLVAQAFIPNPYNLPEINHKDENKLNNCEYNLEWCNHSYNKLYKDNAKRGAKKFCKPVVQYTMNMQYIKEFSSITEARELTGIDHIGDCCNGKLKQSGGYIWRFKNGE